MGILLKIFGIIYLAEIIMAGLLVLFCRKKTTEIKALSDDMPTPSKIHLNEDLDPEWLEAA